jgi:hypothetical protein
VGTGRVKEVKSCVGIVKVKSKKARKLGLKKGARRSPVLEKCCLLLSANESFQNAERDVELLTGIKIGHSSQHRWVQEEKWTEPVVKGVVSELSIDGGKVRLRTAEQGECEWRDYKGMRIHGSKCAATFQDNDSLIAWANGHRWSRNITCVGDGHDGVWNLIAQIATPAQRREVLDWYHLKENLYKVGGSQRRLHRLESLLWQGMWTDAYRELAEVATPAATRFRAYLTKHHARIVDYQLDQELGICIGSGAVESTIKQIGMRMKISGAQWNRRYVPQMLKLRCAYLNGDIQVAM